MFIRIFRIVPGCSEAVYPSGYNGIRKVRFVTGGARAMMHSFMVRVITAMTARDEILARVRGNLGVNAGDEVRQQQARDVIKARRQGPRPVVAGDLPARFRAKSVSMSSTVDHLESLQAVPTAVARYLTGLGLPLQAVCWESLAGLDWAGAGMGMAARAADGNDLVGVTGCFCALAETGTLMLLSGPETAAKTSLLPETHIAVVPVSRIVAGMEEGFALLRAEHGEMPRSVNFVSGPSRTGDIEQTIVIGAHGPYRVHLLLVENA